MSDYTVVSFELFNNEQIEPIRKLTKKLFEATSIKDLQVPARRCYALTIHELTLKESLGILEELKKRFGIIFVVEYGVY